MIGHTNEDMDKLSLGSVLRRPASSHIDPNYDTDSDFELPDLVSDTDSDNEIPLY